MEKKFYEPLIDAFADKAARAYCTVNGMDASSCTKGDILYDRIWYGTYGVFLTVYKLFFLTVLAILLGILQYVIILVIAYSVLREYSFGIHLSSNFACTTYGFVRYIGGTCLAMRCSIPLWVKLPLFLLSLLAFLRYAPMPTYDHPVPVQQRQEFKQRSVAVLMALGAALFALDLFPGAFHAAADVLYGTCVAALIALPLLARLALGLAVLAACFLCLLRNPTKGESEQAPRRGIGKHVTFMRLLILIILVIDGYILHQSGTELLLHTLSNLILVAICCQAINILPITYKLFKEELAYEKAS